LKIDGKLANAWGDLLEEMWLGNRRSTSPKDLKYMISKKASQVISLNYKLYRLIFYFILFIYFTNNIYFLIYINNIFLILNKFSGYSQQDSQELLTFLLDGIHEDLNSITNKPYREIEEKLKDETDDEAAFRFWELHKQRNDSPIVDLFHGQFKSTITCPECLRVSTTFDPFTNLSLPIPKLKKVDLFYVPKSNLKKTTKLSIFISQEALFFDIHDYLQQHLDFKVNKIRCLLIANNECIKILNPSENIMKNLDLGFIFCCEIDEKISDNDILPLHISEDYKKEEYKSYPRAITVNKDFTLFDLRIKLYKYARRFFDIPKNQLNFGEKVEKIINGFINEGKEFNENEYDELIKEEYIELFEPMTKENINTFSYYKFDENNNKNRNIDDDLRKEIIEIFPCRFYINDSNYSDDKIKRTMILDKEFYFNQNYFLRNNDNNDDVNEYLIKKIEYLNNANPDFTYNFDSKKSINSYLKKIKGRYLNLICEFNWENLDQLKKKSILSCKSIAVSEKTKNLTLNDCFNHFKLTEKLEENNEWYCSICKKHQKAFKRLEIYYLPRNLIIHLKRFEYSSLGRYRTYADKIGSTIDFPVNDFDIRSYIIGPHNDVSKYDLYGVSQHFGGVGGGHYTAVCKNDNNWYDYNDSHCGKTSSGNVVSNSAYMLFYKRKEE
jgi:ubiquitin carboxyl-terminal hydrolase 4/11/15